MPDAARLSDAVDQSAGTSPSRLRRLAPAARALALGSASGLAVALGGEPHGLSFVALLGPALLLLAIERDNGAPVPMGLSFVAGLASGFTTNMLSTDWVLHTLGVYGNLPLAVTLPLGTAMWLAQAMPVALGAWLAAALMRVRAPGWLALSIGLVVAATWTPMIFPWRLAASQVCGLVLAQGAELSGPAGVDLLLVFVSAGAMHALRRRAPVMAALSLGTLVLAFALGAWRIEDVRASRDALPSLAVGVVQPSIGIEEKHDARLRVPHMILHREMTAQLEARGAQLVIWPESSYPFWFSRRGRGDRLGQERILTGGVRGPVLFGALTYEGLARWNSAVGIDATGAITGIVDKAILMPFTEDTYADTAALIGLEIPPGFARGPGPATLALAGEQIGILNCYEDLSYVHARGTAALGATFLVNMTNDAWFGDTSAPHLHHMLARLRAIETRLDLVRAVNTGVSGQVLSTGQSVQTTAPYERTTLLLDVRPARGATLYVRFGDWLSPALLGLLLAFGLRRRR